MLFHDHEEGAGQCLQQPRALQGAPRDVGTRKGVASASRRRLIGAGSRKRARPGPRRAPGGPAPTAGGAVSTRPGCSATLILLIRGPLHHGLTPT
eukprot:14175693-Alexandrium_andersonii.AAC.1